MAYIANPDLVERFRTDAPLNKPDTTLFYGVGAEGYTDYPALETAALALNWLHLLPDNVPNGDVAGKKIFSTTGADMQHNY